MLTARILTTGAVVGGALLMTPPAWTQTFAYPLPKEFDYLDDAAVTVVCATVLNDLGTLTFQAGTRDKPDLRENGSHALLHSSTWTQEAITRNVSGTEVNRWSTAARSKTPSQEVVNYCSLTAENKFSSFLPATQKVVKDRAARREQMLLSR